MSIRKSDYPPNWPELSLQVREEANWRCELCGVGNQAIIRRGKGDAYEEVYEVEETDPDSFFTITTSTLELKQKRLRFHGLSKVVLTVAHMDRDRSNNERSNLRALCQRCHLVHDIHQHVTNRRYGRYWKDNHLNIDFKAELP